MSKFLASEGTLPHPAPVAKTLDDRTKDQHFSYDQFHFKKSLC